VESRESMSTTDSHIHRSVVLNFLRVLIRRRLCRPHQGLNANGKTQQSSNTRQHRGDEAAHPIPAHRDRSINHLERRRILVRETRLGAGAREREVVLALGAGAHRRRSGRAAATGQWEKAVTFFAAGLTVVVTLWVWPCAFVLSVHAVVTLGVVTLQLWRVARLTAEVGQSYRDARSHHPLRGDLVAALLLQPHGRDILRNHLVDAVLIIRLHFQHFLVVQLHAVVVEVGAQRVVHADALVFAAVIHAAIPPALTVRAVDVSAPCGIGLTVTLRADLLPIAGALAVVTVIIVEVLETTVLVPILALAGKVPPVLRRTVPILVLATDRVGLTFHLHQDVTDRQHRQSSHL